jgi:transposase
MHNDDSTIVIIDTFESQAFEISHEDYLSELSRSDERPASQQETVTNKEEVPSNDDTSKNVAVENAQKAVSELLNEHYDGKKSINKIFTWLKDFLYPIIKDFLKR